MDRLAVSVFSFWVYHSPLHLSRVLHHRLLRPAFAFLVRVFYRIEPRQERQYLSLPGLASIQPWFYAGQHEALS